MVHKKFMDIQRIKEKYAEGFNKGDEIVIQCKIDGANAAIRYDSETDTIVAQSRKNILGVGNNLRGFWEWTQTLNKDLIKEVLGNNLIAFCEWLCPHSIKYPEDKYNHAYFYDVYDTKTKNYLPQSKVKEIVDKLNLIYVPTHYVGEFVSWEHCMSFMNKIVMGGEIEEGIVVKNQTRLNDPNSRQPFYLKIVGEKFAETHKSKKPISPEQLQAMEENKALAETIVTPARVEKILNKFVDENILPEDWGNTEMPIIAKNLPKAVYEDCVKEESETVIQIENFGKVANSIAMQIARNIMNSR